MRKRRIGCAGALGLAIAVAIPGSAVAAGTQNIDAAFQKTKTKFKGSPPSPNKNVAFDKSTRLTKKFSNKGTLRVDVFIDDISGTPPGADVTSIDFPEEVKFKSNKIKKCKESDIVPGGVTLSTADAVKECKKSIVGAGEASAFLGPTLVTGPVVAFNGPKGRVPASAGIAGRPKGPTILLHSNTATPLVLIGTLINSPLGKPFGDRLVVPVSTQSGGPVPPGVSIVDFDTTVSAQNKDKKKLKKAKKKKKQAKKASGKKKKKLRKQSRRLKKKAKQPYVSAKCKKDETLSYGSLFDFLPPDSDQAPSTEQECTKKKGKGKKKK